MTENEDAYARRQKRKRQEGQGCAILLISGFATIASLGYAIASGLGWA